MSSLVKSKRRLYGLSFENGVFDGLDLRFAVAYGTTWTACTFVGVDFRMANLNTSKFIACKFKDCDLSQVNLAAGQFVKCCLTRCNLQMSAMPSFVTGTEFATCQMQYASFADSIVTNTAYLDCNLHGADLRFSQGKDIRWDGSNLWGAAVNIGCQFFDQAFDTEQVKVFLSMAGRKLKDETFRVKLMSFCGVEWKAVERLMRSDDEHDKPA